MECCNPDAGWNVQRRSRLRRALELDPVNADAIASIGLDLWFGWRFDESARELHRAEALNRNGELVLRNLYLYYSCVGWPAERGIDYARQLLRLDPFNPTAANNLAWAYWHAHQYEQALKAADAALELNPTYWQSLMARAAALRGLGRYDEAIESALQTVEHSEGYTDAYST